MSEAGPAALRILLLEDSAFDAELLQLALAPAYPDAAVRWVTGEEDFAAALAAQRHDLILSDYQLPAFNGAEALELAQRVAPQTPFIFVSGVIGEENAVELLKRGATDCVIKGRLERLPLVIGRALREVRQREIEQQAHAALRQAKEEAERSNELKDQFLAVVSHELRSPLSAIQGWAAILERQADGNELLTRAAAVIKRNAQLQTRMINDLLDMSAVVARKLEVRREPVDLAALAAETLLSHIHAAEARRIALHSEADGPAWVSGDAQRLTQVVANLLGNALKFCDEGGRVRLRTARAADDGAVLLAVEDDGRGISPDFLPHVFDRLRQEDGSRTRSAGGLGLGLAIARAIVELHEGRISAFSEGLGHGARFELRLPAAQAPAAIPATAPALPADAQAPDLGGVRVLLVDDEDDAREIGRATLQSLGAAVAVAASAREALAMLAGEQHGFQVLVSDIGMPGMDGLALLRALRGQPATAALPAVALTAFAMPADRQAGLAAGFQRYVSKPIEVPVLGKAIIDALRAAPRPSVPQPDGRR